MKKVLSLILALVMAAGLGLPAFAEEAAGENKGYSTAVKYVGEAKELYMLTVPATLEPTEDKNSGDVTLKGTWASNHTVKVTADATVEMKADLGGSKTLDIHFDGIELAGNNVESVSATKPVSVDTMTALFGSWTGVFCYNVDAGDVPGENDIGPIDETFEDNNWATIAYACQNNQVPESWAVGDTKTMTIDGSDYTIAIIDKNHDTYTEGGTAPLTFGMTQVYGTQYTYKKDAAYNSGKGQYVEWENSDMRTTVLPAIMAKMPTAVQAAIKAVDKETTKGKGSTELQTTSDQLFLFSEQEIFNQTTYAAAAEGSQYAYFATEANRSMGGVEWLERSPEKSLTYCTGCVRQGKANNCGQVPRYVVFGFCF